MTLRESYFFASMFFCDHNEMMFKYKMEMRYANSLSIPIMIMMSLNLGFQA